MGKNKKIKKTLILGSGALQIGQAGEFDYSGSQAIKALKEEKIKTVLINPNIATIQTSNGLADKVYLYPVTPFFVEKVIQKEKPDSILLSFGGQTALNCGIELERAGILKKHSVKVLGTPVKSILDTEDRELFAKAMRKIDIKIAKSKAVTKVPEALKVAKNLGYPIIIRSAFSLGGLGSSIARNEKELRNIASMALAKSKQILVEEYLAGWKEIEYEVMRDQEDNCITICNMENLDPMGIHTGESIVVAPSQTLTNNDYHKLRELSIHIIKKMGIIGECNVQFAYDPKSNNYRVIELNPRLSRSSALASKATGYPIAFIAAKLTIGYCLPELKNNITKKTTACFEPALDYVVVKIPRWDLNKFKKVSHILGSEMKSVGEVMAIGRKFEEALQKASRMLQVGLFGVVCNDMKFKDLEYLIKNPTDKRIYAIAEALNKGMSPQKIHRLSNIDMWFIHKIKNIVDIKNDLNAYSLKSIPDEMLIKAKQNGFSDKQLSLLWDTREHIVREARKKKKIFPVIKQIDTLAAEFPAKTNYLYLTYNGTEDDVRDRIKDSVIILGSGAYRIGSSVEFDWCCVSCVKALNKMGYKTIMINYNPETVSTDYDICDKLYFDELSLETVLDVYDKEKSLGIIPSMGGQIPNNIVLKLEKNGAKVLGTRPDDIDRAEDRNKFSAILDKIGVDQPEWKELKSTKEALKFAKKAGYPVLVRPSYVLSGSAMNVAYGPSQLLGFLSLASNVSQKHPVVISKFHTNTKEIECDAVAKDGEVIAYAISEHVENAGVHSGDATLVLPPQKTYLETIRRVKKRTGQIAQSLNINGPFNIQFLAKDNMLKVIECNLRASRSFPFVSKVMGCNFIEYATKIIMGKKVIPPRLTLDLDYVGVKAPQFSYSRLKGADPILDIEMSSTGEVGCFGENIHEAMLMAMISTGYRIPRKAALLSIGDNENKFKMLSTARRISEMGLKIYATDNTWKFLKKHGIKSIHISKARQANNSNNVLKLIEKKKVDIVINIPNNPNAEKKTTGYMMRRKAVDYNIQLITNVQLAGAFIKAISNTDIKNIDLKPLDEYS